jgi:uncharacterized RDD family membrane protein YckC
VTAPGPAPAALLAPPEYGRQRLVVTPEGVPVRFTVAAGGDRAGAFALDFLFVVLSVIAFVVGVAFSGMGGDLVGALGLLFLFVATTLYFPLFELGWQGQTPGKRLLRLRVVDARGGPLAAEAVVARNLMREMELWLPLKVLVGLTIGLALIDSRGWWLLAAVVWIFLFSLFPLFNKDRLRVGDLVAGTFVIRAPAVSLLEDLTTAQRAQVGAYAFTEAQLDVYGAYELQVLESVLRGAGGPGFAEQVRTVAEKIRARIGWEGQAPDGVAFLRAFYAAQRGRLERRMLFGKRRASKHDRG